MSVGSADIHKSIKNAWIDWEIDPSFRSSWTPSDKDTYPSLHDGEATPHQPFPYCVYAVGPSFFVTRMSGQTDAEKRIVKDIPVTFAIHAKPAGSRSAKEVAADLLELVLSRFGGHPTDQYEPLWPDLDYGCTLLSQYQTDYGIRTGDEEYQWVIEYLFRIDAPIRV